MSFRKTFVRESHINFGTRTTATKDVSRRRVMKVFESMEKLCPKASGAEAFELPSLELVLVLVQITSKISSTQ